MAASNWAVGKLSAIREGFLDGVGVDNLRRGLKKARNDITLISPESDLPANAQDLFFHLKRDLSSEEKVDTLSERRICQIVTDLLWLYGHFERSQSTQ